MLGHLGQAATLVFVDHQIDSAETLAFMCEGFGYVGYAFQSAQGLIEKLAENEVDVIFIDIEADHFAGIDLGSDLRKHPKLRNAYWVAIVPERGYSDAADALLSGFDAFCTRPVQMKRVLEITQQAEARRARLEGEGWLIEERYSALQ